MENWKTIPDEKVRHIWRSNVSGEEVVVGPDYYDEAGTPSDEDGDYTYVRTEILEEPRRASDYPKPPRPDPLKPIKKGG